MSLRLLIAVTHLLGVGHLTRAAALGRAFARAGHDATLVSGGMPAHLVRTDGVRLMQLPPVRTIGTDFRTLLDENGQPVTPSRLEARRDMLASLVEELRPDVVMTELFPFGRRSLAGEFMSILEHARATWPDTLMVASIRDILVTPAKAERLARTHDILREYYAAVLVHGDPGLVPIEASWPVDEGIRARIRYTGYVDDGGTLDPSANDWGEVVVSGGGSAASLRLYRAALGAAEVVADRPWRILVGAGVAEAEFADLRRAAPPNVIVERARPDFRRLLTEAAASVSQAGYNTVVDLLRTGVRGVLVPFEQAHETEQRLRAERLAELGLATVVAEADLSPMTLAKQVRLALNTPRVAPPSISLDGAEASVAVVEEMVSARAGAAIPRTTSRSGWRVLEDALNHAEDRGATIPFWWRDDDAVAHTRELDRLLALARGLDLPVAIAAIPIHVEASLSARLADEPLAQVLVHGLAHVNHASAGDKKAEFGPHRPLSQLMKDAEAGLYLARKHFGGRLVPVFVPPWNRLAPGLLSQLPGIGYAGLSTFGRRPRAQPTDPLVQVNTHIDPIAWHQGRTLRTCGDILAELAQSIAAHPGSDGRTGEPIGLLTHHLVHDDGVWAFCEELLTRLAKRSIIRFTDANAMFVGAQTLAT